MHRFTYHQRMWLLSACKTPAQMKSLNVAGTCEGCAAWKPAAHLQGRGWGRLYRPSGMRPAGRRYGMALYARSASGWPNVDSSQSRTPSTRPGWLGWKRRLSSLCAVSLSL